MTLHDLRPRVLLGRAGPVQGARNISWDGLRGEPATDCIYYPCFIGLFMPRAYTVATAALALGLPIKWVDNTLSHNRIMGVRQERQGVARRLSVEGLLVLALTALLVQELGLSTARAIVAAEGIVNGGGRYSAARGVSIELDLTAFRSGLLEQLEHAVEFAPIPRRGRPPKNQTGRLD